MEHGYEIDDESRKRALATAGIPEAFSGLRLTDIGFEHDAVFEAWGKTKGFAVSGNTGCGKSSFAAACVRSFFRANHPRSTARIEKGWLDGDWAQFMKWPLQSSLWTFAPDLLGRIKTTFDHGSKEREGDVMNLYATIPLLVIDDLGVQSQTDWAWEKIASIFGARNDNNKFTIVTMNQSLKDFADKETKATGHDRIASRMSAYWTVELPDRDRRADAARGREPLRPKNPPTGETT